MSLAGGDVAAAIANGAAPYLAEVIGHKMGLEDNAKVVAHAIVGAALAAAQGQNAAAGAAGAATGEITGMIASNLYGKSGDELTESQKQTVSALATLASGLAGGLAGDSTASAAYAAQAGKMTFENNWADIPSTDEQVRKLAGQYDKALSGCAAGDSPACAAKDKLEKSYSFLAVAAGTSVLSGPASLTAKAVSSGLSMGANSLGQIYYDESFSYQSLFFAGFSGWKAAGAGYWATVGISSGMAYMDSVLAGKDPTYSTIGAAFGSSLGYGIASGVTKKLGQREISRRAGISMSENAFKYLDEPIRPGSFIYHGMEIGPYPGMWGGAAGSGFSEVSLREMTDLLTPNMEGKK